MDNKHCFVSDGDGHWYFIPVRLKSAFNEWINMPDDMDDDYYNKKYYNMMSLFSNYTCYAPEHYIFTEPLIELQ